MHGGPTRGRHILPISTLSLIVVARAPCSSLWGLGSSLMLVLFPSLVFSFVACSLANCTILYLTGGLCFLLQWWIVRYGLITQSTNLNMREFPRGRALLAGLTSKKVRVLVFMILHAFPLRYSSSSLVLL